MHDDFSQEGAVPCARRRWPLGLALGGAGRDAAHAAARQYHAISRRIILLMPHNFLYCGDYISKRQA